MSDRDPLYWWYYWRERLPLEIAIRWVRLKLAWRNRGTWYDLGNGVRVKIRRFPLRYRLRDQFRRIRAWFERARPWWVWP